MTPCTKASSACPALLRATLDTTAEWLAGPGQADVAALAAADRALLVSRGYNLATSLELALKLKETCGLYAGAYSTADFAHGPRALTREDVPVIAIRPDGPMGALVDETIAGVRDHGAPVTMICGPGLDVPAGALVTPDEVPEELTPVTFVAAGQLLVEAVAREARGQSRCAERPRQGDADALTRQELRVRSMRAATVASAGWPGSHVSITSTISAMRIRAWVMLAWPRL